MIRLQYRLDVINVIPSLLEVARWINVSLPHDKYRSHSSLLIDSVIRIREAEKQEL